MDTKNNIQDLERLTAAVEAAGKDIAPNYREYINMAFGIATDCGEAGRDCFHRLCRQYAGYDARATDRTYDGALKKGRGDVHIGTVFYFAQQAGVDVKKTYDEWKERKKSEAAERAAKDNGTPAATGEDEDDEVSKPRFSLPLFPHYNWPAPLPAVLGIAQRECQADALLIGAFTVIGATLGRHVRVAYGNKWLYPALQTFIVAPPASGKGVLSFLRTFGQQRHNDLREQYEKEMKEYMMRIKKKGEDGGDDTLLQRPKNRMFFIAGNNTGTGILQNIIDNDGEGIIFEPEADTVSTAIKGDYGHWSDTLRKAFDHDPLSFNRRTDNEYRESLCTCLAVLLSGTPQQVSKLIPSAENGLFSRQVFYYMPPVQEWINQFEKHTDNKTLFEQMGERWGRMLDTLRSATFTLELSEGQHSLFNNHFQYLFRNVTASTTEEMNSLIMRLAVNILRMMAVTALLRAVQDNGHCLRDNGTLFPANVKTRDITPGAYILSIIDNDFNAALGLAEPLAAHATHILSLLPHPTMQSRQLSDRNALLQNMPAHFTRKMLIDMARKKGMDTSPLDKWITRLVKRGLITRGDKWGDYVKSPLQNEKCKQGTEGTKPAKEENKETPQNKEEREEEQPPF